MRAWPKKVQSLPGEQPNDGFIDEAAVATTVRGAAKVGMNCPEKQAWRMTSRFWKPCWASMPASWAGVMTPAPWSECS